MEKLRVKLIDVINESGLPLEAVVFVVRDVYRDTIETFKRISEQEKKIEVKEEGAE